MSHTPAILLVDDLDDVRSLTEDVLRNYGFTVYSASHCSEAIRLFEAHRAEIGLLLTDVVMPKMSGRDLASILRKSNPQLAILFTSGYTELADLNLTTAVDFLSKPFTPAQLVTAVRNLLELKPA